MYCRNCGNEVNDKAIACPKCGVNPHSENNFCSSCGGETNPNQVICLKCGVSLDKKSSALDIDNLQNLKPKSKQWIFAFIAFVGYFLPWVGVRRFNASGYMLQGLSDQIPGGELLWLLFLLPLCLFALIVSSFVSPLFKVKKTITAITIAALILAVFVMFKYLDTYPYAFDIGVFSYGLYISFVGTIVSVFFGFYDTRNSESKSFVSPETRKVFVAVTKKYLKIIIPITAVIVGIIYFNNYRYRVEIQEAERLQLQLEQIEDQVIQAINSEDKVKALNLVYQLVHPSHIYTMLGAQGNYYYYDEYWKERRENYSKRIMELNIKNIDDSNLVQTEAESPQYEQDVESEPVDTVVPEQ